MGNEYIREVLNRITEVAPRREAARTAPRAARGAQSAHRPEEDGDLLTADELKTAQACVKAYTDGCALLRQLECAALRPGLSESEAKLNKTLMDQTLALILPLEPVVHAVNRYSAKLLKITALCREFSEFLDNWLVNRKLDRLQNKLDLVAEALQHKSEERPAISDLEAALLGRPQ